MFKSSIGESPGALRPRLEGEAHVWLSDLESWRRTPLLTPPEQSRARTLRHPDAQMSFVAGRSLVRFVLSRYARVEPPAWRFTATRLGRPEITGPSPVPKLRFNLSHTRGVAACIVTAEADCGIDVEELERPLRPLRIAEHSFAAAEFSDLKSRAPSELRDRFFSYWTLKESYYKARGSGIPFRMAGARFSLESAAEIEFEPSSEEGTRASEWQFGLFRPTAKHVLAVALVARQSRPLAIRCFSCLEGGADTEFVETSLAPLRATAREIQA